MGCQSKLGRPWAEKVTHIYYVYILNNKKTGKLYKGYTENLKTRLSKHNNQVVRSTKNKGIWKLVYYEAFNNKTDALVEEKFLKSGRGRERLKFLLKNTI